MRKKNQIFPLALLLLVCLVLVGTGTYAAYTNSSYVKAVAVAGASADDFQFSSNLLSACDSGNPSYVEKSIRVTEGSALSRTLTICNFPKNAQSKVSQTDITYTLHFALMKDGTEISDSTLLSMVSINKTPLSTKSTIVGQVLSGGKESIDSYRISCDPENISKLSQYRIRITATPDDSSKILAGDLVISSASSESMSWTWTQDDGDLTPLDAYNIKLSGTAAGTCTLTWDSANFVISPWSLTDLMPYENTDDGSIGRIKFTVGQENQPTSYRIQFYKKNGDSSGADPGISFNFNPKTS